MPGHPGGGLVGRPFDRPAPDRLPVADFTYATLVRDGLCRVRHRRVLATDPGLARSHLDAHRARARPTEQAVSIRARHGHDDLSGLVAHSDAGSQCRSIAYTERRATAGAAPSVGSVGDVYDNAMAESTIKLFKTELIKPCRKDDRPQTSADC
ncbi:hypothetical protein [Pseudonocardia sp. TMWB2A]|uniref:hypothetical protein n=1 Tax=Pseudonocardia sp. TMWB2A TaxID=687430 RepID=UPI00307DEA61